MHRDHSPVLTSFQFIHREKRPLKESKAKKNFAGQPSEESMSKIIRKIVLATSNATVLIVHLLREVATNQRLCCHRLAHTGNTQIYCKCINPVSNTNSQISSIFTIH